MSHSAKHAGLQEHSVGELYPWSIKQVGDKYCQAFHAVNGEKLAIVPMITLSSSQAYLRCEELIRIRLESDKQESAGQYVDVHRELSELQLDSFEQELDELEQKRNDSYDTEAKLSVIVAVQDAWQRGEKLVEYSFLIPIETHTSYWVGLEKNLLQAYGGYTKQTGVSGGWKDANGKTVLDDSVRYSVACRCTNENQDKLLAIIADCKRVYKQDTIYLSLSSGTVRIV